MKSTQYAQELFNEFLKYRSVSLIEEAQELIQIDSGLIGDILDYKQRVKGLSDTLMLGENKLSAYAEFQQWIANIVNNPNDTEYSNVYKHYSELRHWAKEQFEAEAEVLDRALVPTYDEQEVEIWGDSSDSKDVKIVNYLTHYAEKMSPKQLYMAKDRIFALRKEAQEGREGLSYKSYVKAMLLVLEQIVKRCNSNRGLFEKFQEMQFDLESVNCSEDVRLESTACMSLDIEAAIDLKRKAERIADRHNLSIEEAMFMLQEVNE